MAGYHSLPDGLSSERTPSIRRWQEKLLQRVSLGLALALALSVILVHELSHPQTHASTLVLLSCALGCALLPYTRRMRYHSKARVLVVLGAVAVVSVASSGPEAYPAAFLVALVIAVWSALLLGRFMGAIFTGAVLAASMAAQWLESSGLLLLSGNPASWGNWFVAGLSFAALSLICVWWADYGMSRIQKALIQRDDLIQLVREETEERIDQLERQQSLERQLRQSQKMEALGTLAGGIAHDFNNLLLVITSGSQSAREAEPEELQEILAEIGGAAARGSALTQQLLAFGRRKINERGALHLNTEVGKSLQLIRRLIPSSVALEFVPGPAVQTIEATTVDIDQVIMNLCINARDAMPSGGTIHIETMLHREEGHLSQEAVIVVRDTGIGMSQEEKDRAFEPFFTTKRTGAGTGLGLSVVHSIIHNHKGRLEIESKLGRGSQFRVYLPHFDQAFASPLPTSVRPLINSGERLLLVDDDAAVRKGVARVLRKAGYEVLVAEDGEHALKIYDESKHPINLVITDAVMPNMGGRELCEALAQRSPLQPCLICSGYDAGTLDEGFFIEAGREFLAKPFDNDQLLARVRALIDLHHISDRPPATVVSDQWSSVQ